MSIGGIKTLLLTGFVVGGILSFAYADGAVLYTNNENITVVLDYQDNPGGSGIGNMQTVVNGVDGDMVSYQTHNDYVLVNGNNTFLVRVWDKAGNAAVEATVELFLDKDSPFQVQEIKVLLRN